MLLKNNSCGAARGILLIAFLTLTNWLYAQTCFSNRDTPYLSLDGGAGTSDVLVEGLSFSFLLNPSLSITPAITLGSKNVLHFSTDDIIALETQAFFRWNFLRLGSSRNNTTDIFIQGGIGFLGAYRRFEDQYDGKFDVRNSRSSLVADATLGVTIPLSSKWHIEPSISGGYPFMGGAAITVGYKFPLRRTYRELEYVEVIRILPPSEIVRRVLITQVEYILFAPNIARFNYGLDHEHGAQSLNELVVNHVSGVLKENPDFRVRIEGHANPVYNTPEEIEELFNLSSARANEVARVLKELGVSEEQIIVAAYGASRTVASDHDHWDMNRRVELIMIQVDTE